MSWDARGKGEARYYYASRREGDKVRRVYVGRGERAERAAREIEERRLHHQAERDTYNSQLAEVAIADVTLHDLHSIATDLFRATLLVNGFHQHKRTWRKRRHGSSSSRP